MGSYKEYEKSKRRKVERRGDDGNDRIWNGSGILFIFQRTFYIHVAFCFKKRRIPLACIRRILIDFMRGRKGGGSRYVVNIEQKDGTTTMFFMGKN